MTQKPHVVAIVLLLGVLALGYNVWTYSQLFRKPNSRLTAETTSERDAAADEGERRDSGVEIEAERSRGPISRWVVSSFIASLPEANRNPFVLPHESAVTPGDVRSRILPVVDGILRGEGRRVAWVNGRALSEGDHVDGHIVQRIADEYVVLRRGSEELQVWPAR